MSKRTRGSIRAGAKGRSLRPRTARPSSVHPPPEAFNAEVADRDEEEEDEIEALVAKIEPVAAKVEPVIVSVAKVVEKVVEEAPKPPSSKAAERATVPEIPAARRSDPAAGSLEAALQKQAVVEATREVEDTQPSASDRQVFESPLAKTEEPKAVEAKAVEAKVGDTQPIPVTKVEAAKAVTVTVEEAKPEEAKPVVAASAPADEPKVIAKAVAKAEEPIVVVAKAEEPKEKTEKVVEAIAAEEPAKERISEPAKAKKSDKPSKKKEASRSEASDSKRTSANPDEVDASSVSAEFFRAEEDSLPPMIEPVEDEPHAPVVMLSPATIARRARLRRMVAGVVSFAAVISLAVVGKTLAAGKPHSSTPAKPTAALEVKVDKPAEAKPVEAPKPVEAAKPVDTAKADEAKPADTAKADEAKPADSAKAAAEEPKKDDKPAIDVVAAKKQVESLLNRGKNKDAAELAAQVIAADPSDAMMYLFLGSALQETGKFKESREAYNECVRNATKGNVGECRMMGGHK